MKGEDSEENQVEVSPDDSAKVAGLAFKLCQIHMWEISLLEYTKGTLKKVQAYTTLAQGRANEFLD